MRWSVPKWAVTAADASQHHAGVRVLEELLGLKEGQWRKCTWVSGSHATTALEKTAYYTYGINQSVPKAIIGNAFGNRKEKLKIRAWRWQTAQEIADGKGWSSEDRQFVDKLRGGELQRNENK